MSSYLAEALQDLSTPGGTPPSDLWGRFLGWVHPQPPDLKPLPINPDAAAPDDCRRVRRR
ncbi:hypothetical protein [Actinoplanes sp. N902-109]|uniref:hypothetical protein n=1 Tax=Actinoplanes sp. (strain N902-109) TaxID=649831 RepID=UPI00032953B9|nr:hypothetical protein [Actinoplanes sp. N902-109]AGL20369.1 hypothetical protein L083_6859 [Actinoplanes sp. N902-109]